MYLAGEATHETLWGTVDGAWESGERAAEAALRRIGALPEIEPNRGGCRAAPPTAPPRRPAERRPDFHLAERRTTGSADP